MSVNCLPQRKRLTSFVFLLLLLLVGEAWAQDAPAQPPNSASPEQWQAPSSPQQPQTLPAPLPPANPPAPQSSNTPSQPQSPSSPNPPQQPASPQTPQGSNTTQVPGAGVSVQNEPSESEQQNTPITKAQAKELFRSVDEILHFASQDTGLPIKHQVKRHLITRASVEKYVNKRMKDDKDTQRVEQSRLVLEKFGLLPPNYDLHGEFLKLLAEQVAAYYDPKTKSVNILDWVAPDAQKPVLAHELTHALQDQKVGLDKWELAGGNEDGKPLPDQQEQVVEEAQAARQCVVEGQAMVVLLDYSLAPAGKSVASTPEVIDAIHASMADSKDSPVFAAAPMFLQESLLMPYNFGLDFVRAVLVRNGTEAAYPGMLMKPPIDTRQIMEPETYLSGQAVPPLTIPDLDKLIARDYERFDFGGMGEFDVYLLSKQYGAENPKDYYSHWRGGYYLTTHEKAAPKDKIGLLYFSRWDSPQAAHSFAKLYTNYLSKRYKKLILQPTREKNGKPAAADHKQITFDTEDGTVSLQTKGRDLLIMEGINDNVAGRARDALLTNPAMQNGTMGDEQLRPAVPSAPSVN